MGRKRDGDISALCLTDLMALRERVEAEIHDRRLEYERSLRARGGMTERDGPRYGNPTNPAETWSGQGRRPAWVEEALAGGATLAELEVLDDRPVKSEEP